MTTKKPKTTIVPALLLAACVATGCVRDGVSPDACEYPLRLRFSYTYNRENRDLFAEEVPSVQLFLYDSSDGSLVKRADLTADNIDKDGCFVWMAPAGHFNLVAWGGADSRYSISPAAAIESHTLSLPADADGKTRQERKHLWHRLVADILINGDLTPVYDIDLHKISNDVTVTVSESDADTRALHESEAFVSASNALYDYAGNIHSSSPLAYYVPDSDKKNPGIHIHTFTTLGLSRNDASRLEVSYDGNKLYDGGLTDIIAQQPDIIFDLDDDFRLDFKVNSGPDGNASVALSINGWLVKEYNVALQ